ncbi:MAG: hypothetical protein IGR93_08720 [Hydrococcus sp. C42_A2020_068]|uniref:hypothetical protein n=1 Tax=Pleurocapsa sp. PCC 7327 TaxID=118163 RepID=UPI0002D9F4B6|nr:hypothetical protein [Pleurocapsa sp. PCC 7327]MBF2020170.1 hypothetical protein [Hydrococcus sp. C42_A2020_068]
MTLSDREEQLLEWLEDYGVIEAWKPTEPLAIGNVEVEMLDKLMKRWRHNLTQLRDMRLRWFAFSFDVEYGSVGSVRGVGRLGDN